MYLTDINNHEGEEVIVIGKFDRLEDNVLILKCMNNEIQIKHAGLDSYKTGLVRVSGIVENGILIENSIYPIGDEFDFNIYSRFVNVASKYPNLF